jgi:hypothetical protein
MHMTPDARITGPVVRSMPEVTTDDRSNPEETTMPKFVIERPLPGAGSLSAAELHTIAAKSNQVLGDMAPRAQWNHSYVTADKLYCVYIADDEAAVREHAECGGFPAEVISRVTTMIDPTTGE